MRVSGAGRRITGPVTTLYFQAALRGYWYISTADAVAVNHAQAAEILVAFAVNHSNGYNSKDCWT